MKCSHADIWDFYNRGFYAVIPTNIGWKQSPTISGGMLNVMGRGLAFQAKERFPECAEWLGTQYYRLYNASKRMGDPEWLRVYPGGRLLFFPTKPLDAVAPWRSWRLNAALDMIEQLLDHLPKFVAQQKLTKVAVPLLGAGNGGLDPNTVKNLIMSKLGKDPRFVLVIPLSNEEKIPYGKSSEEEEDGPRRLRSSW